MFGKHLFTSMFMFICISEFQICRIVVKIEWDLFGVDGLFLEFTILKIEQSVCVTFNVRIVGNHQTCRLLLLIDAEQQIHHLDRVVRVQIARRFVQNQNLSDIIKKTNRRCGYLWVVCQRTGNCDTLLLATTQFARQMTDTIL